jgi:hypothetical protein
MEQLGFLIVGLVIGYVVIVAAIALIAWIEKLDDND